MRHLAAVLHPEARIRVDLEQEPQVESDSERIQVGLHFTVVSQQATNSDTLCELAPLQVDATADGHLVADLVGHRRADVDDRELALADVVASGPVIVVGHDQARRCVDPEAEPQSITGLHHAVGAAARQPASRVGAAAATDGGPGAGLELGRQLQRLGADQEAAIEPCHARGVQIRRTRVERERRLAGVRGTRSRIALLVENEATTLRVGLVGQHEHAHKRESA